MKYLYMILLAFSLHGCLYFNERGVSTTLYNECKEYYTDDGQYIKECPKNLVEYEDLDK